MCLRLLSFFKCITPHFLVFFLLSDLGYRSCIFNFAGIFYKTMMKAI